MAAQGRSASGGEGLVEALLGCRLRRIIGMGGVEGLNGYQQATPWRQPSVDQGLGGSAPGRAGLGGGLEVALDRDDSWPLQAARARSSAIVSLICRSGAGLAAGGEEGATSSWLSSPSYATQPTPRPCAEYRRRSAELWGGPGRPRARPGAGAGSGCAARQAALSCRGSARSCRSWVSSNQSTPRRCSARTRCALISTSIAAFVSPSLLPRLLHHLPAQAICRDQLAAHTSRARLARSPLLCALRRPHCRRSSPVMRCPHHRPTAPTILGESPSIIVEPCGNLLPQASADHLELHGFDHIAEHRLGSAAGELYAHPAQVIGQLRGGLVAKGYPGVASRDRPLDGLASCRLGRAARGAKRLLRRVGMGRGRAPGRPTYSSRMANSAQRRRSRRASPSSAKNSRGSGGRIDHSEDLLELVEDQHLAAVLVGGRAGRLGQVGVKASAASVGQGPLLRGGQRLFEREQRGDQEAVGRRRVGGRLVADADERQHAEASSASRRGTRAAWISEVLPAPEGACSSMIRSAASR